jgi:hypothetical protein
MPLPEFLVDLEHIVVFRSRVRVSAESAVDAEERMRTLAETQTDELRWLLVREDMRVLGSRRLQQLCPQCEGKPLPDPCPTCGSLSLEVDS